MELIQACATLPMRNCLLAKWSGRIYWRGRCSANKFIAPPQFLPGATAPPAVAAAAAAAAATAVSGAPSDQHEADLTNLILAWYHTGFFTAVYQERHGRR